MLGVMNQGIGGNRILHDMRGDSGLRRFDRDVLALIEVDVPDTEETRAWLRSYARDVLCQRFRQEAVYLKFVGPVEQLIVSEEEIRDEDEDGSKGGPAGRGRARGRQEAYGSGDLVRRD